VRLCSGMPADCSASSSAASEPLPPSASAPSSWASSSWSSSRRASYLALSSSTRVLVELDAALLGADDDRHDVALQRVALADAAVELLREARVKVVGEARVELRVVLHRVRVRAPDVVVRAVAALELHADRLGQPLDLLLTVSRVLAQVDLGEVLQAVAAALAGALALGVQHARDEVGVLEARPRRPRTSRSQRLADVVRVEAEVVRDEDVCVCERVDERGGLLGVGEVGDVLAVRVRPAAEERAAVRVMPRESACLCVEGDDPLRSGRPFALCQCAHAGPACRHTGTLSARRRFR
jgi:hypothetical protein